MPLTSGKWERRSQANSHLGTPPAASPSSYHMYVENAHPSVAPLQSERHPLAPLQAQGCSTSDPIIRRITCLGCFLLYLVAPIHMYNFQIVMQCPYPYVRALCLQVQHQHGSRAFNSICKPENDEYVDTPRTEYVFPHTVKRELEPQFRPDDAK